MRKLKNIHPGEVLKEFLEPFGITAYRLSKMLLSLYITVRRTINNFLRLAISMSLTYLFVSNTASATSIINIIGLNGEIEVEYFCPRDSFANISWSTEIDQKGYKNSYSISVVQEDIEIAILINKHGIELFVGQNDSVQIYFDAKLESYYFEGSNSELHRIYNEMKGKYDLYKMNFTYANFDLRTSKQIIEDINEKLDTEIEYFENLFPIESQKSQCINTYMTSELIKILGWIEEGFPFEESKKEMLEIVLLHLNLDQNIINRSLYNLNYYDLYYSTLTENKFSESDNYILKNYGYLKNVPDTLLMKYLLQSAFISVYKAVKGQYFDWCEIYKG